MAQHLFPLSALFCPTILYRVGPTAFAPALRGRLLYLQGGDVGIPIPPRPTDIVQRVTEMVGATSKRARTELEGDDVNAPQVATEIPMEVLEVINRERPRLDDEARRHLNRWRVIFVSRDRVVG